MFEVQVNPSIPISQATPSQYHSKMVLSEGDNSMDLVQYRVNAKMIQELPFQLSWISEQDIFHMQYMFNNEGAFSNFSDSVT